MELIIVTGLSGAGKSQAANCLEDLGYYCVDNMPPRLMPDFIRLAKDKGEFKKIAFVMDIRGGQFFDDFDEGIADLKDAEDFINLGADRLGTSRVVKAVKALERGEK